ncbi:3'(2'),5'-bisphosphate nucleotidase [Sphingobacteriales bacterium UPWRP_1]|nr:3'(2'),5'-bisphosphate nucleotidase [Sphingobacteriales bacterium TSM_CSM]PSJ78034.1 3'(2'),5'-bisphosphate nucleotidase [Sphingobacteriales bacterium UPWRP_1]
MTAQIDINLLLDIARLAGKAILQIYNNAFDVTQKDDNSPLTLADTASNQVIIDRLTQNYPQIPIISEENKQTAWEERQKWEYCWLIDPLDGTKEFIKRNGEFTINIALIHRQSPVLGLVYIPVQDLAYYAVKGKGSYKVESGGVAVRIHTRPIEAGKPVITFASRSHRNRETNEFIDRLEEKYGNVTVTGAGSALKFCMVAEGKAHVYPRFSPCMEWDTAAGHIVAAEAGATVNQPDGSPLLYNKENLLSPYFVVSV